MIAAAALATLLWVVLQQTGAVVVHAQYPDASPDVPITAGDPRSDGGGPGLVGSPVEIALGIVFLGVVTVLGTTMVIRLTRR